jgi:hypothetical protein
VRGADHSSRGVLPRVLCDRASHDNEEALTHWGLSSYEKEKQTLYKVGNSQRR